MRPTLLVLALIPTLLQAQWTLQQSGTTASLRGIHAVTPEIAWASGTSGTVLHTTDGGAHWRPCATPPAAERLDFRGIQAFDAQTAIVMSSGKGDLSRLYKTTDACQTWTLVFTNPDPEGFWDVLQFQHGEFGFFNLPGSAVLIGDPLKNSFDISVSMNITNVDKPRKEGESWFTEDEKHYPALPGEALFAASNSSAVLFGWRHYMFASGGKSSARVIISPLLAGGVGGDFSKAVTVPMAHSAPSAGIFSLFASTRKQVVAVGGDYLKPEVAEGTSAFTIDGGFSWTAAKTPPHGYRSSVAYNPAQKSWITVGPNGTDLSTDDGRNWHALRPSPGEVPDSDRNWNALSLPFVVGPHGRIGRLNPATPPRP